MRRLPRAFITQTSFNYSYDDGSGDAGHSYLSHFLLGSSSTHPTSRMRIELKGIEWPTTHSGPFKSTKWPEEE